MTTVRTFAAYTDASGLNAVIESGAFVWAFDLLGTVRSNLIAGPRSASRRERETSVNCAAAAYRKLVESMSAEWLAANAAMYAD